MYPESPKLFESLAFSSDALTLGQRTLISSPAPREVFRLRPEIAKNKDGRMIILVGELANIIDRRQTERVESCPYVFQRHGRRIKHYNRAWRTARHKAGFPGKLFYDARRTAARNMDRAGVLRQTAKQVTGHKTDAVYNRYRIVNEQDIREGMAQAQVYLAAQKSGHHTDTDAIRDNDPPISP